MLLSSFVSSLTMKKVSLGKDNHQAAVPFAAYELLIPGQMKSLWTALHLGTRNMDFISCSFNKVLPPSPPFPSAPLPFLPHSNVYLLFWGCTLHKVGVVLSCTTELFCEHYRFFHWLIRSCTGSWVKISSPKNSPIVQFDTTPTQSPGQPLKWPIGAQSPYLLWNLSGASSLWRWKSKQSSAPIPMPK